MPIPIFLLVIGFAAVSSFSGELFSQVNQQRLPDFVEGTHDMTAAEAAILDSPASRHHLPCTVKRLRSRLGFDLRFVGWFKGWIRRESLHPETKTLSISYRVSSESHPDQVLFFKRVDRLDEVAAQIIAFQGLFLMMRCGGR